MMKKTLLIVAFVLGTVGVSFGQGQGHELGVRFGGFTGNNGVALDYAGPVGQFSRVHADLAFANGGIYVDALYDFLYRPLGGEAFSWYLGVGVGLGLDNPFRLAIPFEAGLEYRFNTVPLSLGIDYRPALRLIQNTDFESGGWGFNVRYRLGG